MKAVIISDPHAHKYGAFNQDGRRLLNVIAAIEQAWDLAAEVEGLLIIPGDIFNNHQTVATEVMVAITKLFIRKAAQHQNVDVVMISGNHDHSTKNTFASPAISAVHALAELSSNVWCIDDWSYSRDNFYIFGVPYYSNPDDLYKAISAVAEEAKEVQDRANKTYLMMHQNVGFGVSMVPDDIDPNDPLFATFDLVFNGHIHEHSFVTEKFINVGTPLHRDAGDIGKDKGILILDTDTNEVERVLFNYPQFRKIDEGEEIPAEWRDDYIIIVPKQIEVKLEEKEIQEKFDHTRVNREGMIENYITIKCDTDKVDGSKAMLYCLDLLSHANKI